VKKGLVTPGEPLCVIEEYSPGGRTEASPNGLVYSTLLGTPTFDRMRRIVAVRPIRPLEDLRKGDLVLIEIRGVQEKIAVAQIVAKDNRSLKHPRSGVIIGRRTEPIEGSVGIGDLLLAVVSANFNGLLTLDIHGTGLGVILAVCDTCGGTLQKSGPILVCSRCGRRQRRKTHPDYGNVDKILSLLGWKR